MGRVADHHVTVCQEMLQYRGRMSYSVRMCGRNLVQYSSFPNLYEELDSILVNVQFILHFLGLFAGL